MSKYFRFVYKKLNNHSNNTNNDTYISKLHEHVAVERNRSNVVVEINN